MRLTLLCSLTKRKWNVSKPLKIDNDKIYEVTLVSKLTRDEHIISNAGKLLALSVDLPKDHDFLNGIKRKLVVLQLQCPT